MGGGGGGDEMGGEEIGDREREGGRKGDTARLHE